MKNYFDMIRGNTGTKKFNISLYFDSKALANEIQKPIDFRNSSFETTHSGDNKEFQKLMYINNEYTSPLLRLVIVGQFRTNQLNTAF